MENVSILHPDSTERTIAFKFTNTTDTDKDIYIKDITLYTFLRNIDWVNNIFSWVELRSINAGTLVINPNDVPQSETTIDVPILCCLRIPPGSYKNTETIVKCINDRLTELSANRPVIAIKGLQATHGVPGSLYDISDIAFILSTDEAKWYPAVIDSAVISNGFNISQNNNVQTNDNPTCIPVLEYNSNGTYSVPVEGSMGYNDLLLYNSDIMSKMGSGSLTSHAMSFINGITNTLTIDNISISKNDLFESEYGLIRYYENGKNYTEFIVNPSNNALINEIKSKCNSLTITMLNDNYPELTNRTNYALSGCLAYPFFPTSTELYIRVCNTGEIDKFIESQLSSERVFGAALASMNVSSDWTNSSTITININSSTDTNGGNAPDITAEDEPTGNTSFAYETMDTITRIQPKTASVNAIITVPSASTTSVYVTGNNQRYPLWRSTHMLTYRVIN